jgi:adhesin/invasin
VLGTLTEFEQPLRVLVLDHLGVPVRGVVVNWTATGGGSVAAPTSVTDAGGEAMIEYTFGAEARLGYGATAAVPGLIGSPVVWFDMHATPGTPVVLAKTGGDGLVVQTGAPVFHTVTVRDSYGNGTQGVGIDWAIGSGSGSLFTTHNFTVDNGTAENRRTLGPELGNQTVTASAPSLPGAQVVTFTAIGAEHVVRVLNGVFVPDAVTAQVGDSVAWQWQGITDLHNITFTAVPGAPLSEPNRTSGVVWRVFPTAGTFAYRCTNHTGMAGSVTVVP